MAPERDDRSGGDDEYPYVAEIPDEAAEPSLEELLRDPEVGQHVSRSLFAIRRIVTTLLRRDQSPAVHAALALVRESAQVASFLSMREAVAETAENPFARDVAEARLLLGGDVVRHGAATDIDVGDHWRTVLRVLNGLRPAYKEAQGKGAGHTNFVVRQAALWIEVFVGRRASVEIIQEALLVIGSGRGRPKPGVRSRTSVLRDLFRELGLPTATASDKDFATQVSRLLKDI